VEAPGTQVHAAVRRRVTVAGTVQGVGFRPFAYRTAVAHGLRGYVLNRSDAVEIEIEGTPAAMDAFIACIAHPPAPARIERLVVEPVTPRDEARFEIAPSVCGLAGPPPLAADSATCPPCLRELRDPADARHRYPLINCTRCGPRFTIARSLPYDRLRTTMARFTFCPQCRCEYLDPADRRFHAEPNACPMCGPQVRLLSAGGEPIQGDDPVLRAAELLIQGSILAIKGLGGYHLAVRADDEQAVIRLRRRKRRPEQPLAVMTDLDTARSLCDIDPAEEELLASCAAPIVLLRRREGLAPSIAPGSQLLGLMLPYTPLHHLLLDAVRMRGGAAILVMTSGNRHDEPIAWEDDEAQARLGHVADAFLVHDRQIAAPCDDSVVRVAAGRPLILRRSRGYVPQPMAVPFTFRVPVLACGGHMKNAFCIGYDRHIVVSQHIGDLETHEGRVAFAGAIAHWRQLLGVEPEVVVHDLHPHYASTQYALQAPDVRRMAVQHHHAHIAAVMAEHGLTGPVIGVAMDGTGYGTDGQIWGGEFLIADYAGFSRVAHLAPVELPGGEAAIMEPWRVALAWLKRACGPRALQLGIPAMQSIDPARSTAVARLIDAAAHCPLTSSAGRLFDAAACLITGRTHVSYEGQAAAELEDLADADAPQGYPFYMTESEPIVVHPEPLIRAMVQDLQRQVDRRVMAARFHQALADMITAVCRKLSSRYNIRRVVLGGGVFQNALLVELAMRQLAQAGLTACSAHQLPPNDGGLCAGQAAVAAAMLGGASCA
jgi:hydrogenase maturation protein HypF